MWLKSNVTIPNGEVPYGLLKELLLLPEFDNSSLSLTRDEEIC